MTCELYWRDGIVLVERGAADPHRDGCADCKRAHAARQELIDALPLVGASFAGDPHWQANVWRRIDGDRAEEPAPSRWRWQWQFPGALVAVCAVVLWLGLGRGRNRVEEARPSIKVVPGSVAMRSVPVVSGSAPATPLSAHVGDSLRIAVSERSEVWIYRDKKLVRRCQPGRISSDCTPDDDGTIAEYLFSLVGTYQVVIVDAPVAISPGVHDEDLAALISAEIRHVEHYVDVR